MPARLQMRLRSVPFFVSFLCIGKVSSEDGGALLRGRATASNVSEVSADVASPYTPCRTVTKDSCSSADRECYEHVVAELYPGATMPAPFSYLPATFEGIQNHFHERKQWLCPKPCAPCNVRVSAVPSWEEIFTVRYGECVPDGAGGSLIATGSIGSGGVLPCTAVHFAVFKHFSNPHCSDLFAPPQTWSVFTEGGTSQDCRNKTGHLVGQCGGRDTFLGWTASAPAE